LAQPRKARGWTRSSTTAINVDAPVWVREDGSAVASSSPAKWLRSRAWLVIGFVLLDLSVVSGLVLGLTWPPRWELRSKVCAIAALAALSIFQLLGMLVADALREPCVAWVRGRLGPFAADPLAEPKP